VLFCVVILFNQKKKNPIDGSGFFNFFEIKGPSLWLPLVFFKRGKKKSDLANHSLVRVFFWKHQRTGSFHERTGKESAVRTVGLLKISKHLRSQG
jgi:hypothetical protein